MEILVREVHSGTQRAEYVYFVVDGKILHVSQIPGVKKIEVEETGTRRKRRYITWSVPADKVAGCEGLRVEFSKSKYPRLRLFNIPKEVKETIAIEDLESRSITVEEVLKRKLEIVPFGEEKYMFSLYTRLVPQLVEDIRKDYTIMGIRDLWNMGGAERIYEVYQDPYKAFFMSMVLPSSSGRILSLYEKISSIYEIWLATKVARILYDNGAVIQEKYAKLEPQKNEPMILLKYKDKYIHIIHQATIYPSNLKFVIELLRREGVEVKFKKEELLSHVIPDIAVVISDKIGHIGQGNLHKYPDKVSLLLEAKLSLSGLVKFEQMDLVISQVKTYRSALNNRPKIIVAIHHTNPEAVKELSKIEGIKAIDGLNPRNPEKIEELKKEVIETIS